MKVSIDANAKWDRRLAIMESTFTQWRDEMARRLKPTDLNAHARSVAKLPRYTSGDGDLEMRVRWDAYWAVRPHLIRTDATDAQMDSVLRRIVQIAD